MLTSVVRISAALLFAFSFAGCEDAPLPDSPVVETGHGAHEPHGAHGGGGHPETFGEAYGQLCSLRDTVSKAFADKNGEAAHGPLHDVGHLLEEVSELGGKSELSDEAKQAIETNVETLLDAFGAVDKKMHNAESGKDYSEVSEEIDAAIKAIGDAAGELAEHDGHHADGEGDGHDEDHGDDEGHKDGDEDGHGDHKDGDKDDHAEHKDGDKDDHAEHKDGDHDEGHADEGDHKDGKDDHADGDADHADKDPADGEEAKKPAEGDDKEE